MSARNDSRTRHGGYPQNGWVKLAAVAGTLALGLVLGGCPEIAGSDNDSSVVDTQESAQQNIASVLTIFSVSPNTGSTSGGTVVTLTGSGFTSGISVFFGDTPATNVTVQQSWSLQATSPAGDAGPVSVTIVQGSYSATLADAFRYVPPALAIHSIVPAEGGVAGGTAVTIKGEGFSNGVVAYFDDIQAASVIVINDQLITAETPVHAAGAVDVSVTTGSQTASLDNGFEYIVSLSADDGTDSDNDGLTDYQELSGYEIWVDQFGLGFGVDRFGNVTRRFSFSDPSLIDTDGDGLSDFEEYQIKCDAGDRDTDTDGIDDYTEWVAEWTSPVTVDTDGDARGDGNEAPNAALFDGQEKLKFFDASGRLWYGGTSPILDDTDGDGVSDFDEWGHPLRSAVVADIPRMKVDFVGGMTFSLDVTLEDGTSVTEGSEYSLSESEASTNATSNETSWEESIEFSQEISTTFGLACCPPGPTWTGTLSAGFSEGFTEGGATTWSEESTTEVQEGWVDIQEATRNQSRSVSGGTISASLKVINQGNIAFTLRNLVISALIIDPTARDAFRPLTTFRPPVEDVTLAAYDETGVLVFQTEPGDVGSELLLDFMAEPRGLLLDVASFDLLDADGRNFAFLNDVTNARTATVIIDSGPSFPIETYRVATEVDRNADGTPAGITIGEVMTEFLRIPFETTPRDGSSDPTQFPDGVQVLTKVRDIETDFVDENAFWVVYGTSPQYTDGHVDFQDFLLHAGDRISLVYTEDRDEDGVFKREEFTYLTSDEDPDSDDDGLTDYVEIRQGWDLILPGQNIRRVYPSPTNTNLDQDMLDDAEELAAGTHPKDPDTDGDGLIDGVDNCPLNPLNAGPTIELTMSADVSGSEITLSGTVYESLLDGRCDEDDIDRVEIDWDDGTAVEIISGNGTPNLPISVNHIYATQNVDTITVTAYDVRGALEIETFDVSISFPTDGLIAFYPLNDNGNDEANNGDPVYNGSVNTYPEGTAGRFGIANSAICFREDQVIDGNSPSKVSLPALPLPGAEAGLSVSAWVLPHGANEEGIVVGQDNFAALYFALSGLPSFVVRGNDGSFYSVSDTIGGALPTASGNSVETCLQVAPSDSWTFYCGTARVENGTMKIRLYRGDGADLGVQGQSAVTLVGSLDVPGVQPANNSPSTAWQIVGALDHDFGPVPANDTDPFEGRVDDVRIYDRHLVEVEVNALFNEPSN